MIETSTAIYGLNFVESLSYLGFFLAVGFSGYAIPIPEEIILILAGYIVAEGIVSFPLLCLVCVLGAIFGDFIIYYLSSHGSRFIQKHHARIEKTHMGWYMHQIKTHPGRTIFISRFIVGLRFINPITSGLLKVPKRTFIVSTIFSATIYLPLVITLGYYFHDQVQKLLEIAEAFRYVSITVLFLAVVVSVFFYSWSQGKKPRST